MGRNEDLLTFAETAARLDVTPRHLGHMMRLGHIRPAKVGRHRGETKFRPQDVNAVLELKRNGRLDLAQVARAATQARNLSLSNAAKLEKLCAFLGLENNRLRTDEDSVFMLHMKAQDAMKLDPTEMSTSSIMAWASTFNGFDEAYLQIIEGYTADQHPWQLYLDLANKLMANQRSRPQSNLRFAYACLDSARRHLRHVSYFYVMTRSGERLANDLFIKGEVDDEIIAQLHPILEGLPH